MLRGEGRTQIQIPESNNELLNFFLISKSWGREGGRGGRTQILVPESNHELLKKFSGINFQSPEGRVVGWG